MSESLINRTDDEIRKAVMEIATKETGIRNFKSTGVLRGILEVFSRVVGQIYKAFISPIYSQTSLKTARNEWLSQWGLLLGVARKLASKANGEVSLTAYAEGQIDAGIWITVSGTDLRFRVVETTAFSVGENKISVEAEFPGSGYNISDDEGLLSKVVSGVESVRFAESWIKDPGTDDEDDESYRMRIENRWIALGVGNPPASFRYYAESVPGVKAVKLIRTPRGYGTVDIVVVAENGLPSPELLQQVYSSLHDHALICNDLHVKAPEVLDAAVEIEYSGSASENAVQERVLQYVYGLGIGGRMEIRGIYDALESFSLDHIEVLVPARDVQADEDSIVVASVVVRRVP